MHRLTLTPKWQLVARGSLLFLLLLGATASSRAQGTQHGAFAPVIHNQYTYRGIPRLLISEVYPNPPGSTQEPEEEWVELYNPAALPCELDLYLLGDAAQASDHEGMYTFPAGALLPPQGVIVVANHALAYQSAFGRLPDYEFNPTHPLVPDMAKAMDYADGSIALTNTGDEVLLLDQEHRRVDEVAWGNALGGFYPTVPVAPEGASLERWPAYHDSDTAADWRSQLSPAPHAVDLIPPTQTPTSTSTATGAITLTPTLTPTATRPFSTVVSPTPGPADHLLVSEVFALSVSSAQTEWFELHNPTSLGVLLDGFAAGNAKVEADAGGMYRFPGGTVLGSGQVLVVAARGDGFRNVYGTDPDFEIQSTLPEIPDLLPLADWGTGVFDLYMEDDELLILDEARQVVDAVSWGASVFAFNPPLTVVENGWSFERCPPEVDTNTRLDWLQQPLPSPGELPAPP